MNRARYSSHAGAIKYFAYSQNNQTDIRVTLHRSGICLTKYPSGIESVGFCRSYGGSGGGLFSIYGSQTGVMLASNVDIINISVFESRGLFELHYNFEAELKHFNFVLNSKRNWESSYCVGSNTVTLFDCFVVGEYPNPSSRVIEESVKPVDVAITNKVILPVFSMCSLNKNQFSNPITLQLQGICPFYIFQGTLLVVFLLNS